MISGTSKILSKAGPVDLLTITKMLRKYKKCYGNILETDCLCKYGTHFLKGLETIYVRGTMLFVENLSISFFRVSHFYIVFYEDEDRENEQNP